MPLYSFRCSAGHALDLLRKADERDDPVDCDCGLPLTRGVSLTAPPTIAGRSGPREGAFVDVDRSGFTVTHEGDGIRVREKGGGFVAVDWVCPKCGTTTSDVYEGDVPPAPLCLCGVTLERRLSPPPDYDWFKEQCGSATGYYDEGLGMRITSREQRKAEMQRRGLVEYGDVGDVHDDYQRKVRERAARENAEIREMLQGFEHGPDAARLKAARDHGQVPDWAWMKDALK